MLTSSMVQINVKLAESDSTTVAPTSFTVMMTKDGKVTYNGKSIKISKIESTLKKDYKSSENNENATVAIVAEVGVPWKKVQEIMTIANKLRLRAIIATQPRK